MKVEYNGFQILKISKKLQQGILELFKEFENDFQVLSKCSERPLVVHCNTRQLSYVTEGKGYVAINGVVSKIEKGDLVIIDKNSTHSFICDNEEIKLMHIHWPKNGVDFDRKVIYECYPLWDKYR